MKLITETQDCGCGAALAKDVIEASSNEMEYLHFFEMLDEHEYDEIKKSGSGSGKYGIIKGSANYEEFKKNIRDRIHVLEIETGRRYESSFFEARTSEIAYVEWGKCMRNCNRTGLLSWIENESEHYITIGLRYLAPTRGDRTNKYNLQIEHNDGTLENLRGKIKDKDIEIIKIKRKCGNDDGPSKTIISGGGGGFQIETIVSKFYCGNPTVGDPDCPSIIVKLFEKTSDASNLPTVSVEVDEGYKIIGGGAKVNHVSGHSQGCLITESYPSGNKWITKAKDHLVGANATITAYALAIYDPNNAWDVRVFSDSGKKAHWPEATVKVDNGYVMTGGGAKDNWSSAGNILTASYPDTDDTWKAKGKDHVNPEETNITVYAIGIKPVLKCNKKLENKVFQFTSEPANDAVGEVSINGEYILSGGGTLSNWKGPGSLLTSSYPSSNKKWTGSSKVEKVSLDIYAIGIRYQ